MNIRELWQKLQKVNVTNEDDPFVNEDIASLINVAQSGDPLTQVVGDDGGVGYSGPDNYPIIAFRKDGDVHDRLIVWADGAIYHGDGTTYPPILLNVVGTFSPPSITTGRLAATVYTGSGGIPDNSVGTDGEWHFGGDGHLYYKTGGAWVEKV